MIPQKAFSTFTSFLEEFKAESDRGCAVLTLCVLEEALVECIKKKLPDGPNSKTKDAYKNFAPKGRLSVTVINAYLLGILSKEQVKNFNSLIEIRNVFAHQALEKMAFDEGQIKKWSRDLRLAEKKVKLEGRDRFLLAATEIFFNLVGLKIERLTTLAAAGFQIQMHET